MVKRDTVVHLEKNNQREFTGTVDSTDITATESSNKDNENEGAQPEERAPTVPPRRAPLLFRPAIRVQQRDPEASPRRLRREAAREALHRRRASRSSAELRPSGGDKENGAGWRTAVTTRAREPDAEIT